MPRKVRPTTCRQKQALLKNQATNELRNEGYHFGWLTPINSNTKITDFDQGARGKYYIFYRSKTRNTRVVYIGDTYYYLQGD